MDMNDRQEKILDIIINKPIETQEELTSELKKEGFDVTQSTVSRDIRKMKLSKVSDMYGHLRYVAYSETDENLDEKYLRILRDGFISMDNADNILVIKTVSGMAMAVAAALDHLKFNEIVGSIAGDDTIMCAVRSVDLMANVMSRLRAILNR